MNLSKVAIHSNLSYAFNLSTNWNNCYVYEYVSELRPESEAITLHQTVVIITTLLRHNYFM